jgi:hypothetical protein
VLLALLGCGAQGTAHPDGCPEDCRPDPARATRVTALLRGVGRASALAEGIRPGSICFGEGPGTLRPGPWLVLPAGPDDAVAAARLGHLAHHARHASGLVAGASGEGSCEEAVDAALREEAAAHALEIELHEALGVSEADRFANADEVLALPPERREAAVLAYLRAHPEGGGGYAPLGRDYAVRCARTRGR